MAETEPLEANTGLSGKDLLVYHVVVTSEVNTAILLADTESVDASAGPAGAIVHEISYQKRRYTMSFFYHS